MTGLEVVEMESKGDLDPRTWPARGRVGFRTSGDRAGSFVFLHLGTADREPDEAFWQAFFRTPGEDVDPDDMFVDNSSGVVQRYFRSLNVDWAPDSVDGPAEATIFGLRSLFKRRGAEHYSGYDDQRAREVDLMQIDPAHPWAWLID